MEAFLNQIGAFLGSLGSWWALIIFVVAFVLYAIFDWKNAKLQIALGIARAKSMAKDYILTSGAEQEQWVVNNIYPILPGLIKIFINVDLFRIIVRKLYQTMKDLADDGQLNHSQDIAEETLGVDNTDSEG